MTQIGIHLLLCYQFEHRRQHGYYHININILHYYTKVIKAINERTVDMRYLSYEDIQDLQQAGNYKGLTVSLGYSDIATLILSSVYSLERLSLGGDGYYRVHIIDERTPAPEHYTLHSKHRYWLKVYDDRECMLHIDAKNIRVYRAGDYGILIRVSE